MEASIENPIVKVHINPIYKSLINDSTRHLVIYGTASSGKSRFAAQKIILRTRQEEDHTFLCLRKIDRTVKESVYQELNNVINDLGLENEFYINRTEHEFRHWITGNRILCKGLDWPEKIKSIANITGMWLDESTDFTEEDLNQLSIRIRGEKKNYVQFIYTFNPVDENLPIRKKLFNDRPDVKVVFTTYKDNLFATEKDKEILEGYKTTNPLFYDIYCLGKWGIVDKSNKFFYAFDPQKHIGPVKLYDNFPIWCSWDFNKDPMTCIVGQRQTDRRTVIKKIFKLNMGSTPEMCEMIQAAFPNRMFIMTGDATGRNRSALVRGNINHWIYIRRYFGLTDAQLRVRSANISHINSRILVNSVAQNTEFIIDPECKELIDDCTFAKVDEFGELVKDREQNKNDFLDCLRYFLDANYPEFIVKMHKHEVN